MTKHKIRKPRESKELCNWRYQAIRACKALDKIYAASPTGRKLVLECYGVHHSEAFRDYREQKEGRKR